MDSKEKKHDKSNKGSSKGGDKQTKNRKSKKI